MKKERHPIAIALVAAVLLAQSALRAGDPSHPTASQSARTKRFEDFFAPPAGPPALSPTDEARAKKALDAAAARQESDKKKLEALAATQAVTATSMHEAAVSKNREEEADYANQRVARLQQRERQVQNLESRVVKTSRELTDSLESGKAEMQATDAASRKEAEARADAVMKELEAQVQKAIEQAGMMGQALLGGGGGASSPLAGGALSTEEVEPGAGVPAGRQNAALLPDGRKPGAPPVGTSRASMIEDAPSTAPQTTVPPSGASEKSRTPAPHTEAGPSFLHCVNATAAGAAAASLETFHPYTAAVGGLIAAAADDDCQRLAVQGTQWAWQASQPVRNWVWQHIVESGLTDPTPPKSMKGWRSDPWLTH